MLENESPNISFLRKWWKRIVFRYAGHNIACSDPKASRSFYNLIGRLYDWIYAEGIYNYDKAADYVVHHYVEPGDKVLDVGCGTGLLTGMAASKASLALGTDVSTGMILQAVKKNVLQPNCLFMVCDCRSIPLKYEFDKIISGFMMVILNREDQVKTIREMNRLLKPGGSIVFLTAQDWVAPQWHTRDEWKRIASEGGFESILFDDVFEDYRVVCLRSEVTLKEKSLVAV